MKPVVHLLCGRIGSGKTTYARKLASETGAVRFTHDEWMHRLFGPVPPEDEYRKRWNEVEYQIWDAAQLEMRSGKDVILDFGFWTRQSRDAARTRAKQAGGVAEFHYLACPPEVAFRRTMARSKHPDAQSLWIDEAAFEKLDALFEPPQDDEEFLSVSHDVSS